MKTIQSSPIQAENIIDAARLGLIEDVKRLLLKNINNKNNNNKDNNNTIVNTMNKYKYLEFKGSKCLKFKRFKSKGLQSPSRL